MAVENYNSKTGEKWADFIPAVIWGKQAENTAQFMSKGSMVAISGRISTGSYDAKDGTKRYVTEVIASTVKFLGKAKGQADKEQVTGFDPGMTPVFDEDTPF